MQTYDLYLLLQVITARGIFQSSISYQEQQQQQEEKAETEKTSDDGEQPTKRTFRVMQIGKSEVEVHPRADRSEVISVESSIQYINSDG